MGVYNPKKKMPTSCYMCCDSLYCEQKIKNPVKMAQGRADDCPLIEISDIKFNACMELLDKLMGELDEAVLYGGKKK